MGLWGNTDDAANSAIFAPAQVHLPANTANRDALYANLVADGIITGVTVSQYLASPGEVQALRQAGRPRPPHAGWVLRTEGSGGRSGRIQYETLVALRTTSGDGSDDALLPDFTIVISTQPDDDGANSSIDGVFTVVATTVPTGGALTYLWQYTTQVGNNNSWATTVAVSGFSNQTNASLSVANSITVGILVRCLVSVTGGNTVTSDTAEFLVD